jgi:hypothetical protein
VPSRVSATHVILSRITWDGKSSTALSLKAPIVTAMMVCCSRRWFAGHQHVEMEEAMSAHLKCGVHVASRKRTIPQSPNQCQVPANGVYSYINLCYLNVSTSYSFLASPSGRLFVTFQNKTPSLNNPPKLDLHLSQLSSSRRMVSQNIFPFTSTTAINKNASIERLQHSESSDGRGTQTEERLAANSWCDVGALLSWASRAGRRDGSVAGCGTRG